MTDLNRAATRYAPHGMVASPDHLASEAGVALLQAGGSAVDAAVAANAVLTVTCPHMCGIGGDLWALVHEPGAAKPLALNASGRAGSGADPDALRAEGHAEMPFSHDIHSVPIPGCVDGWTLLHNHFGRASWSDVLEPAIELAASGFPASPLLAWSLPFVQDIEGADDVQPAGDLAPGVRVRRQLLAEVLRDLAAGGRDSFYRGAFGHELLRLGAGEYAPDDMVTPMADWVEAVSLDVWNHRLWTVPGNSQGYLTLAGAWMAERLPLPNDPEDGLWAHLLVETARASARDRDDVLHERTRTESLLDHERMSSHLAEIDPDRRAPGKSPAGSGDTIYLCAVDKDRRGVSLIQSNASGYGAGIVVPGTGVFLHNRGIGFSLEPGHPAEYGPLRRPPSTLSPASITELDGSLRAVFGTMGGDGQPQVLLQILTRYLAHGATPGEAISAPRWVLARQGGRGFDTWRDDQIVHVEADAPIDWFDGLRDRGHEVESVPALDTGSGHAHMIAVDRQDDGSTILAGAADPRAYVGAATGY